jgi:uncharacterized protein YkwD
MPKKRILLFITIFLALGAALFFKNDLENVFLLSKNKLADFKDNALGAISKSIEQKVSAPPPLRHDDGSALGTLTKSGTIDWTNTQRKNNGLASLSENKKLDESALMKAQDMLKNQYFEHVSPSGVGPSELAGKVQYEFLVVGENLAMGIFFNDQDLVDAWMASPGHRENILNKSYSEIGVAVVKGTFEGKITWMAVQEFGVSASVCPKIDKSLKAKIDESQTQIKNLLQALNSQKNSLSSRGAAKNPNYSSQISAYNSMVLQYNSLVEKTKKMIEDYNFQVNTLNTCLKKYQ